MLTRPAPRGKQAAATRVRHTLLSAVTLHRELALRSGIAAPSRARRPDGALLNS
jgi:hypothetical protein